MVVATAAVAAVEMAAVVEVAMAAAAAVMAAAVVKAVADAAELAVTPVEMADRMCDSTTYAPSGWQSQGAQPRGPCQGRSTRRREGGQQDVG